jgi:hypothetical protein
MDEFKPKYRKALWMGLIFFPPSLVFLGPRIFENPSQDPMLTFSWFTIFVMISLLPRVFIKRIRLEKDWFTIEKYIGATHRILYEDVYDVGAYVLKYKGGTLNLQSVLNAGDFMESISEKIDLDRMEGKLYKKELDALVTSVWSFIPILLVPIGVYFLPIHPKWMPLASLFLIVIVILAIGKMAEKSNKDLE